MHSIFALSHSLFLSYQKKGRHAAKFLRAKFIATGSRMTFFRVCAVSDFPVLPSAAGQGQIGGGANVGRVQHQQDGQPDERAICRRGHVHQVDPQKLSPGESQMLN
jgi:hypothetical protein